MSYDFFSIFFIYGLYRVCEYVYISVWAEIVFIYPILWAYMVSFIDSVRLYKNPLYAQLREKEHLHFSVCYCLLLYILFVYVCNHLPESKFRLRVGIKWCYTQRQTCHDLLKCFIFFSCFLLYSEVIYGLLNIFLTLSFI